MNLIGELTQRVFTTRNIAHREHFKTQSYAKHMALGDFYGTIIEQIDEIVEVYQGRHGLITIQPGDGKQPADIITWLEAEAKWIEANRDKIADGSRPLQNLIDELCATYLRTIYKLENLH